LSQPNGDLQALEKRQADILARLKQLQQQVEALVVTHGSTAAEKSSVQVKYSFNFCCIMQVTFSCSFKDASPSSAFRILYYVN
jgi:hypothetical protein